MVDTPLTEAVTAYALWLTVEFAVNVDEVATPLEFDASVSVVLPFAKVPLAPDEGAVNVTEAPLTGLFLLSSTVAENGLGNAVPTLALCPDPVAPPI